MAKLSLLVAAGCVGGGGASTGGTFGNRAESYLGADGLPGEPVLPGETLPVGASLPPQSVARAGGDQLRAVEVAAGPDLAHDAAAAARSSASITEAAGRPMAGHAEGASDSRDLERSLRHDLATSDEPAAPALELAGLLCALERFPEALEAVQQAQTRSNDQSLRVAKAGLLRDLGRRHLAAAELRALLRDYGAANLHPGLLFELAEIEWLEGDPTASQAVLSSLQQAHVGNAWCLENRPAIEALGAEMHKHAKPQRVRVRDLLGNLRGAPTVTARLRELEELTAASLDGDAAVTAELHGRAIAIACADDSPSVRARAVQLAQPDAGDRADFVRTALADPAALVRSCAAARADELLGSAAAPGLLDSLANEADASAFAAMHEALCRCQPGAVMTKVEAHELEDATVRARIVASWRRQCGL